MNLIIGLLIIACLFGSEHVGYESAENVWVRLIAVMVAALIVPGLAFFQTAFLLRRMNNKSVSVAVRRTMCQRMTASHAVVWLTTSLAIVWAIRWQDVVRGNWGLNRWPLIDELIILAPVVFSLVASWAIFYELQPAIDNLSKSPGGKTTWSRMMSLLSSLMQFSRERIEFVSIRFRLYFMLILIPVCVFVLVRDMIEIVATLPVVNSILLIAAGLVTLLLFFPLLILFIWRTSPIENLELRNKLQSICHNYRLNIMSLRQWDTGEQVVNAVVVGLIPRFRVILLSDGLLKHFEPAEIAAVLRHEAGHVRLWHLPTRMFFFIVPLIALTVYDSAFQTLDSVRAMLSLETLATLNPMTIAMLVLFGLYTFVTTRWLSHQMELEADIFSLQAEELSARPQSETEPDTLCKVAFQTRAEAMRSALLRLAALSPGDMNRRSFFHPSIAARLEFIRKVEKDVQVADRFKVAFARRRRILAAIMIAACLGVVSMTIL